MTRTRAGMVDRHSAAGGSRRRRGCAGGGVAAHLFLLWRAQHFSPARWIVFPDRFRIVVAPDHPRVGSVESFKKSVPSVEAIGILRGFVPIYAKIFEILRNHVRIVTVHSGISRYLNKTGTKFGNGTRTDFYLKTG